LPAAAPIMAAPVDPAHPGSAEEMLALLGGERLLAGLAAALDATEDDAPIAIEASAPGRGQAAAALQRRARRACVCLPCLWGTRRMRALT
jgi:hypothetical protein